jgi:hypothetical protein
MSVPLLSTLDRAQAIEQELLLERQAADELLELQILVLELLEPIGRGRELLRVAPIVDDGAALGRGGRIIAGRHEARRHGAVLVHGIVYQHRE